MKKSLFVVGFTFLLCGIAHAQDWQSALKSAVSNAADKVTGGAVTEAALVGTWKYTQPGIKLEGENTLTDLAASASTSTLQTHLVSIYNKVGIKSGACTYVFNSDKTFSTTVGTRKIGGTYTFDSATHAITLNYTSGTTKLGSMDGYAYLNGTNLQLLFSATKALTMVETLGEKVASLSTSVASMSALLKQFKNVYIGFEFTK